jgi:predicted RNA-binding Zn-ribbon protein involved in translation (DUF1610 family)
MEVRMPEQAIKITCPHCGRVRTINPAVFGKVKGPPSPALEKAYQKKLSTVVESGKLSGTWVNLKCPSCGMPYQYNQKTHKSRSKPSRASE